MKVLVATKAGQGQRANDFHFARDGELVMLGASHDGEAADAECGCRRSFVGTKTSKSTTTARVVESELEHAAYVELIVRSSVEDDGGLDGEGEARKARREAARLLEVAARFQLDAVVERRGDRFYQREVVLSAGRARGGRKSRRPGRRAA